MSKHTFTCHKCHELFNPSKEEIELWLDGETQKPDMCDECFTMINRSPMLAEY